MLPVSLPTPLVQILLGAGILLLALLLLYTARLGMVGWQLAQDAQQVRSRVTQMDTDPAGALAALRADLPQLAENLAALRATLTPVAPLLGLLRGLPGYGYALAVAPDLATLGMDGVALAEALLAAGTAGATDMCSAEGTLELEPHCVGFVIDLIGRREAHGVVPAVEGQVAAIRLAVQAVDEEKQAELGDGFLHGHSLSKTAILTGPQGSGKSAIARQLAKRWGCAKLVDEWNPSLPIVPGALHITNCEVSA